MSDNHALPYQKKQNLSKKIFCPNFVFGHKFWTKNARWPIKGSKAGVGNLYYHGLHELCISAGGLQNQLILF